MEPRSPIGRLVWDDWNQAHLTKHDVLPIEVVQVLAGETMVRETYKERLLIVGPTPAGRMLAVVIGAVPGDAEAFYIFSARPASRKERRLYSDARLGGAAP